MSTDTDAPHPPSSSTQTTHQSSSTADNTSSTEESHTPITVGSLNEKESLRADNDAPEIPEKKRGLLKVPSRSSSKHQPSPTSTKLSGVTATDPRDSTGDGSKGSKTSSLGHRRNGSAASSKMSITQTGASTGPSATANTSPTTTSPTQKPKAKKKSFFSMLCCGAPDSGNAVEGEHLPPANKITKVTGDRPTTASKPTQNATGQQTAPVAQPQTEKDALKQEDAADKPTSEIPSKEIDLESKEKITSNGDVNASETNTSAREQPLANLAKSESSTQGQQSNPAVIVQPPTRTESTREATPEATQPKEDGEGDVKMENTDPVPQGASVPVARSVDTTDKTVLPPPPPPPAPEPESVTEATQQKWLLPPIAPRFQGKKCLVLDLDETLVHSSFKV